MSIQLTYILIGFVERLFILHLIAITILLPI
jgi:hypothetical protein